MVSDHDAARAAGEHGAVLSSPGAAAEQPAGRDRGAGAAHRVRRTPRGGSRIQAGRNAENRARGKGILVSSGPYNSRQLLQLSGIGPADLLSSLGIEVVLERRASAATCRITCRSASSPAARNAITLNDIVSSPWRKLMMGLQYAAFRTGPLTIAADKEGAFLKTDPRLSTPDVQIHFLPFSTDKMGEALHAYSGFSASVCQLRPESRGSLRIKSADPAVAPEIRINYLATETDRTVNVEGLENPRGFAAAPALKPFVVEEVDPLKHGPKTAVENRPSAKSHTHSSCVQTCSSRSSCPRTSPRPRRTGWRTS